MRLIYVISKRDIWDFQAKVSHFWFKNVKVKQPVLCNKPGKQSNESKNHNTFIDCNAKIGVKALEQLNIASMVPLLSSSIFPCYILYVACL